MLLEQRRQVMLQLHQSDQQFVYKGASSIKELTVIGSSVRHLPVGYHITMPTWYITCYPTTFIHYAEPAVQFTNIHQQQNFMINF